MERNGSVSVAQLVPPIRINLKPIRIRLPADVVKNKHAWKVVVNHTYVEFWLKNEFRAWFEKHNVTNEELIRRIDRMAAGEIADWLFLVGLIDRATRAKIQRLAELRNKAVHDLVLALFFGKEEAEETDRIVNTVLRSLRRGRRYLTAKSATGPKI